jgi:DHA1 family bicyclomycin/chloramphenicol resistance-like MFS transporter
VSDRPGLVFILVLGSLTALGPLSIDMYLAALPALAADFRASPSEIQMTLSACILGLALGQLLIGPWSDSVGRRRPVFAGLIAYALVSVLCVVAPSASALVALRFIQGVAGSAALVTATAMGRDLYHGAAAARFFSMLMLVMGAAPILAPVLGAQILLVVSWHGIFLALAAVAVILIGITGKLLPETLPPDRRHSGGVAVALKAFVEVLRDRTFLAYAVAGGLAFAAMFAYIAGSPFVLQSIYGMSPQAFGITFGINALGLIGASQVNGKLVHRFGPRRMMMAGMAMMAGGGTFLLAAVLFGAPLPFVLAGLFVVVATQGLVAPNTAALALAKHGRSAGSAAALLGTLRFTFGALSAPLVGLAGEHTALPMALIMALCGTGALAVAQRIRGD